MLPDMSLVRYVQDFLGDEMPPEWHASTVGNGIVRASPNLPIGGALELAGWGVESVARARLGEDIDDSPVHAPNFSIAKCASFEARISINSADGLDATIGFTGERDPDNVGGAFLYRGETQQMFFQVVREGVGEAIPIAVIPTIGPYMVLRVKTAPSVVVAYIDNNKVCEITDNIPAHIGMPFEFQVWNRQIGGVWANAALNADYVAIVQNR